MTQRLEPWVKDARRLRRFWSRVERSDGCWLWLGGKNRRGYGTVWDPWRHGVVCAHRLAYELLAGTIPDGLTLDHLCKNTSCVNPAHLEPVTHRENLLRGDTLPGINARKIYCKNNHPLDEANTYRRPDGDRDCRTCKRAAQRRCAERRRNK